MKKSLLQSLLLRCIKILCGMWFSISGEMHLPLLQSAQPPSFLAAWCCWSSLLFYLNLTVLGYFLRSISCLCIHIPGICASIFQVFVQPWCFKFQISPAQEFNLSWLWTSRVPLLGDSVKHPIGRDHLNHPCQQSSLWLMLHFWDEKLCGHFSGLGPLICEGLVPFTVLLRFGQDLHPQQNGAAHTRCKAVAYVAQFENIYLHSAWKKNVLLICHFYFLRYTANFSFPCLWKEERENASGIWHHLYFLCWGVRRGVRLLCMQNFRVTCIRECLYIYVSVHRSCRRK